MSVENQEIMDDVHLEKEKFLLIDENGIDNEFDETIPPKAVEEVVNENLHPVGEVEIVHNSNEDIIEHQQVMNNNDHEYNDVNGTDDIKNIENNEHEIEEQTDSNTENAEDCSEKKDIVENNTVNHCDQNDNVVETNELAASVEEEKEDDCVVLEENEQVISDSENFDNSNDKEMNTNLEQENSDPAEPTEGMAEDQMKINEVTEESIEENVLLEDNNHCESTEPCIDETIDGVNEEMKENNEVSNEVQESCLKEEEKEIVEQEETTNVAEEASITEDVKNNDDIVQTEELPIEVEPENLSDNADESELQNGGQKQLPDIIPTAVEQTNGEKNIKTVPNNQNGTAEDNGNNYCYECKKIVYPLEKLSTKIGVFHKVCFRCTKCKKALTPANFSFNNNKPYCTPHYMELFKKRGKYDEADEEVTVRQLDEISNTEEPCAGDEMPAPDTTRSLVADIEKRTANTTIAGNRDDPEFLPAPDTTKKMKERFSAMGVTEPTEKRQPIDIKAECPDYENGTNNDATVENQPQISNDDVVRCDQPLPDDRPKTGTARAMADKFNQAVVN